MFFEALAYYYNNDVKVVIYSDCMLKRLTTNPHWY